MDSRTPQPSLEVRAARHAALGEPTRLAIVDALASSDRSPSELAALLDVGSNLLSHHLDVLEAVGLIERFVSSGDRRRRYVRLADRPVPWSTPVRRGAVRPMLFVCSRNSARSQLAAALWRQRTGGAASSAGTHPAAAVHRGAVAAARRAGVSIDGAVPRQLGRVPRSAQVVTVCDQAHEELDVEPTWWHWSLADPVERDTAQAFDATVAELRRRIDAVQWASPTTKGERAR